MCWITVECISGGNNYIPENLGDVPNSCQYFGAMEGWLKIFCHPAVALAYPLLYWQQSWKRNLNGLLANILHRSWFLKPLNPLAT